MANHVLLDNVTHKNLRVRTALEPGRGFDTNVVRVFPVEFAQLQREYPLFFVKNAASGHFETIALLGFSDRENLYLTSTGWDAAYVPLSVQRQPFLIGFQEQVVDGVPRQAPVVHVDLDHPSISDTEGEPVFLPHGGESPYLERINSILGTIRSGHDASRALSQVLVGLELIESIAVNVEFDDGSKQSLAGLYTINEDRLRGLGANGLEVLHGRGYLQDIYMLLASLLNVKPLIARKNRVLSRRGRTTT
jgi:hypothetical protein